MSNIDINTEIKLLTESLNNLNELKKDFDILKNKYKSLHLKKNHYHASYDLCIEDSDINYELAEVSFTENEGNLYCSLLINDIRKIKSNIFIEIIGIHNNGNYNLDAIFYDDYYNFASLFKDPKNIVYEIENKILKMLSNFHNSYIFKIKNDTGSTKVQQFIDNLIFI